MSKIVMTEKKSPEVFKFIEKDEHGYYIKQCRGCRTYEDGRADFNDEDKQNLVYLCDVSIPVHPKTQNLCPCSLCVVKMVCNFKCEELDLHIKSPIIRVGDKKDKNNKPKEL